MVSILQILINGLFENPKVSNSKEGLEDHFADEVPLPLFYKVCKNVSVCVHT